MSEQLQAFIMNGKTKRPCPSSDASCLYFLFMNSGSGKYEALCGRVEGGGRRCRVSPVGLGCQEACQGACQEANREHGEQPGGWLPPAQPQVIPVKLFY